MATDAETIEFLLDQLGRRGTRFTTRRMFGEYCLYRDGLPVALVCDDVLFVKDTAPGRETLASFADVQFGPPYPGARPHLRVPPDLWDDGDAVRRLLDATAAALPAPKVRKTAVKKAVGGADAASAKRSPPASRVAKKAPATKRAAAATGKATAGASKKTASASTRRATTKPAKKR